MAEQRKFVMRPLTWVCLAVAVVCVIAAVVYFTKSAEHLPSFFPGHQAGLTKTHTKHGIAMLLLAVVALIGAWFASAPRTDSTDSADQESGSNPT
jgi:amino acid permease